MATEKTTVFGLDSSTYAPARTAAPAAPVSASPATPAPGTFAAVGAALTAPGPGGLPAWGYMLGALLAGVGLASIGPKPKGPRKISRTLARRGLGLVK